MGRPPMPRIISDPEIATLLAHPDGLQDVLARVLVDHPMLWWGGWWSPWQTPRDPTVTLEQLRHETVAADGPEVALRGTLDSHQPAECIEASK